MGILDFFKPFSEFLIWIGLISVFYRLLKGTPEMTKGERALSISWAVFLGTGFAMLISAALSGEIQNLSDTTAPFILFGMGAGIIVCSAFAVIFYVVPKAFPKEYEMIKSLFIKKEARR